MLDSKKISLALVKEAFRLNEHEAQGLLSELSPDGVYPYELWQKAYSTFWKAPAIECARLYEVENPPFPELGQIPENYFPTETYAKWMVDFFFEMARRISVKDLESGFDYIIESTYDNKSAVSDSDRMYLFYHFTLVENNIENRARSKGLKNIFVQLSAPAVLLRIFPDTMVVDKLAAVRYLLLCGYPFVREVKGLTRQFIEQVRAALAPEASQQSSTSVPLHENTPGPALEPDPGTSATEERPAEGKNIIRVPAALWEGKSDTAVRDAMRDEFDDSVIAYVLFGWCKIQKTSIGKLLLEGKFAEKEEYADDKSYRNFVNKLLKKANSLTIIKA